MKLRTGFVSNSSSSSFLIVGKSFEEIGDLMKFLNEHLEKFEETYAEVAEDINEDDPGEIQENIQEVFAKLEIDGIEINSDECSEIALGVVVANVENGVTELVLDFEKIFKNGVKTFRDNFKEEPSVIAFTTC